MDKKVEASTGPASIIGYDDAASAYSMEHGPPAYQFKRQEASSVKITRLVAGTIIVVTLLGGIFYLLGTYIDARTSCRHLQHSINKESPSLLLHPASQFMAPSPTAEARIAPAESKQENIILQNDDDDSSGEDGRTDNELGDGKFRFPLTLSMEDIGSMMHRNQRAQVNCMVEKKKAEEIVTESPKHFETPFGNLTTDPRYVHVTGEAVYMSCRTGNQQRPTNPREGRNNNNNNNFQQGPMAMSGAMPTIHVIPLSASGRIMNGRGQNQDQSHSMMGPPMPFPMSSRHDMMQQHELRGPGPMHRSGAGIPLPMMTQNHQGPHGPHGNNHDSHMPLVMGQPMHSVFPDLQPRSTEFEDDEVESRRKRSLASCSCACE